MWLTQWPEKNMTYETWISDRMFSDDDRKNSITSRQLWERLPDGGSSAKGTAHALFHAPLVFLSEEFIWNKRDESSLKEIGKRRTGRVKDDKWLGTPRPTKQKMNKRPPKVKRLEERGFMYKKVDGSKAQHSWGRLCNSQRKPRP